MPAPATIESEADPRTPGRTAYRITSLYSPGAVQNAVADLMGGPDVARAEFTTVRRMPAERGCPACWMALGYVVVEQAERMLEAAE